MSDLAYSEVSFRNTHENLNLAGMLFLPDGDGPFPTVVIIHGSGTSRRNSVWYLSVTQHLQQNGIAVLLPDKRGSEKSEGKWLGSSFEELATAGFDPITYWKDVDVPVLFALGEDDENVPVNASIERLKENNLDQFTIKVYPDGGHALRDAQTNKVSERYLDDLVTFIK